MGVLPSLPTHAKNNPPAKPTNAKDLAYWDGWYFARRQSKHSGEPGALFAIYRERVFRSDSHIIYQSQTWKKDDGNIIEEHMGGTSRDSQELSPVSFDFYSLSNGIKIELLGSIDGKQLSYEIFPQELKKSNRPKTLQQGTILTSFVPVWLARHIEELSAKRVLSFTAIYEDDHREPFRAASGSARMLSNATPEKDCFPISVRFEQLDSIWCIKKTGEPLEVQLTSQGILIESVSESIAQKALKEFKKK